MSYGIRVDCHLSQMYPGDHSSGPANQIKIYCPSRYTKENLRYSAHFITGHFLELQDPYNAPCKSNRSVVLEPTFSTDLHSFNSSRPSITAGDFKVYFTQLAMEHGLGLKVELVQNQATNKSRPLFRILTSSIEEAKQLARVAHQVGSLSFRLVMSTSLGNTETANHVNIPQVYQRGGQTIEPPKDYSDKLHQSHTSSDRLNYLTEQSYMGVESAYQESFDDLGSSKISQQKFKNNKLPERNPRFPERMTQLKNTENRDGVSNVSIGFSQESHNMSTYKLQDQSNLHSRSSMRSEVDLKQYNNENGQYSCYGQEESICQGRNGLAIIEKQFHLNNQRSYLQNTDINSLFAKDQLKNMTQRQDTQQRLNVYQVDQSYHESQENNLGEASYRSNAVSMKGDVTPRGANYPVNEKTIHTGCQKTRNPKLRQCQQPHMNPEDTNSGYFLQNIVSGDQDCMEYLSSGPSYQDGSNLFSGGVSHSQSQYGTPNKRNNLTCNQNANQYGDDPNVQLAHVTHVDSRQEIRASTRQQQMNEYQSIRKTDLNNQMQYESDYRAPAAASLKACEPDQANNKSEMKIKKREKQEIIERKEGYTKMASSQAKGNTDMKAKASAQSQVLRSCSPQGKYDTLLVSCYGQLGELSKPWLKRIYNLAEKLKEMPHDLFGRMRSEVSEARELLKFSNLNELHPLGKFIHKHPQLSSTVEDDSEIEDEPCQDKYDKSHLISLEFGHLNFGGNHVVHAYKPWKGVAEASEQILIGSVSRGRIAKLPEDAGFEDRATIIEQAHQDVLQWKTMFRAALINQRIKDELKLQEKERAMFGIINRNTSIETEGKADDLTSRADNATKSTASNRSSANYPGLRSVIKIGLVQQQNENFVEK